jgi:hypothetical protein
MVGEVEHSEVVAVAVDVVARELDAVGAAQPIEPTTHEKENFK